MARDQVDRELRAIRLAISRRLDQARKEGRVDEVLACINRGSPAWLRGIREEVRLMLRPRTKRGDRAVARTPKRKRA